MLNFSPGLESLLSFLMNMSFSSGKPTRLISLCLLPQLWRSDNSERSQAHTMSSSASPWLTSCVVRRLIKCVSLFSFKKNAGWSMWACAFSAITIIAADTFPVWRRLCSRHVVDCSSYPSNTTQHSPYFVLRKELYCPNTSACVALFYHLMKCSNEPPSITNILYLWSKLVCIVWHTIPHVLLDFSAKFRVVYFPQEEVSEERSRNCRHPMSNVGCDVLVFSLC